MNNSPIGVFDSGMGGLSVWRELRRSLPCESMIYYGDGLHCPYGEKPAGEVLGYIEDAVRELLACGVKLIVLACNTATMTAVKYLRSRYDIPFVGMEPAIKPAAGSTQSGVVGVLATRAALESEWFAQLSEKYAAGATIVSAVGEGFVEVVEAGEEQTPHARELVEHAVRPLIDAGADRIVLGCTHYPFLTGMIEEVIADSTVKIIDPAPAIARRVASLLDEYGLRASENHEADYEFISAAGDSYTERLRIKAVAVE